MNDRTGEDGQPRRRGVFDVDEDRALEVLRLEWGEDYDVGFDAGTRAWLAVSRDHAHRTITGQTPDELRARLLADWPRAAGL